MASSQFLGKLTTTLTLTSNPSFRSVTKLEVTMCIDKWQEEATRYADRIAGVQYNKRTSIPVMLSPFMEKLKQFCDSLQHGILNSKQLHALAKLLKPVADEYMTAEKPDEEYDFLACKDLILKMKPLLKHAHLPDRIFEKTVRPVFSAFIDHTDNIVAVYKLIDESLAQVYRNQAEIFLDKMLSDDPQRFHLFAKAFIANPVPVLKVLRGELIETQLNLIVNSCIEGKERQVGDLRKAKL